MKIRFFLLLIVPLLAFSETAPKNTAAPTLDLGQMHFIAPAGWIELPVTSPMRKATWRSSAGGDAAEVSFFTFGKDQGGTVNENIQRWFTQFSESASKAQSATVVIGNRSVTFARSEGGFVSGMPGASTTPLPDYGLCGAIIETSDGLVFIKMVGPKATIEKLEKPFTELVSAAAKS